MKCDRMPVDPYAPFYVVVEAKNGLKKFIAKFCDRETAVDYAAKIKKRKRIEGQSVFSAWAEDMSGMHAIGETLPCGWFGLADD